MQEQQVPCYKNKGYQEKAPNPAWAHPRNSGATSCENVTNLSSILRQKRLQAQIPTFLPNMTNLSENSSKIILSLFLMLDMECDYSSPDRKDPRECVRTRALPQFRRPYEGVPA